MIFTRKQDKINPVKISVYGHVLTAVFTTAVALSPLLMYSAQAPPDAELQRFSAGDIEDIWHFSVEENLFATLSRLAKGFENDISESLASVASWYGNDSNSDGDSYGESKNGAGSEPNQVRLSADSGEKSSDQSSDHLTFVVYVAAVAESGQTIVREAYGTVENLISAGARAITSTISKTTGAIASSVSDLLALVRTNGQVWQKPPAVSEPKFTITKPAPDVVIKQGPIPATTAEKIIEKKQGKTTAITSTGANGRGVVAEVSPKIPSVKNTTPSSNAVIENRLTPEKIVERYFVVSGVTEQVLAAKLEQLNNKLMSEMARLSANPGSNAAAINNIYRVISDTNKIDNLGSIDITNSTFSGGSITSSSIGGTSGSFSGSVTFGESIDVTGSASFSSDANFDSGTLFVDATSNRVGVSTSSPSDTLAVNGNLFLGEVTAPSVTVSRLYNSGGDLYWNGSIISAAASGNWTGLSGNVYRATGNVGVGTTTPYAKFSVEGSSALGNSALAGYFIATSSSATSIFAGNLSVGGTLAVTGATSFTGLPTFTNTGTSTFGGGIRLTGGLAASSFVETGVVRATSTTASSTFAWGVDTAGLSTSNGLSISGGAFALGSNSFTSLLGNGLLNTGGALTLDRTGDWMGTLDGFNASDLLGGGFSTTSADYYLSATTTNPFTMTAFRATSTTATSTFGWGIEATLLNITSATATSTFANGIQLASGCFRLPSGECAGTGNGSVVSAAYDWLQQSNTFGINSLTPTTTLPIWIKSSATSTFAGGIESWSKIAAPYFNATSTTATSTFAGGAIFATGGGNVGVGTTSPWSALSITGNTDATTYTIAGLPLARTSAATSNFANSNWFLGGSGYDYSSTTQTQGYYSADTINNIAVGPYALGSLTTGRNNVAMGRFALASTTTGYENVAIGDYAMASSTTGSENTAVGYSVLRKSTTGRYNTAQGYTALKSNTVGEGNTAQGHTSLLNNTSGDRNTAQGYVSLISNTTGSYNVAQGYGPLRNNTTGYYNTALGSYSMYNNTTAWYNSAIGSNAFYSNTTGSSNSALGNWSLYGNTTGSLNLGLGVLTMASSTTGIGNIALGYSAGRNESGDNETGSLSDRYSMFLGYLSGRSVASTTPLTAATALGYRSEVGRDFSIALGGYGNYSASVGIGTSSPFARLSIEGNSGSTTPLMLIATSSATYSTSTAFIIDSQGRVGIGTTTPYAELTVQGEIQATNLIATSTTATSTLVGGLNVGKGGLVYDYSSGITSIAAAQLGSLNFDDDAGAVSWVDMNITSAATQGTIESYSAQLAGTPILTIYGEAGSSGGVQNARVSIGTTTPYSLLSVWGGGTGATSMFELTNSASTTLMTVLGSGLVGIGTTSPFANLSIGGSSGGTSPLMLIATSSATYSTSTAFMIDSNGKVGIGTTTPWQDFSVNGKVAFDNLSVAGGVSDQNVCINTTTKEITYGASCTGSSLRFKHNIEDLDIGLEEVKKLRPVSFVFNGKEDFDRRVGLIAEEVYAVDSRLVFFDSNGTTTPRGVYYENVVPVLVKAVQELNLKIDGTASSTPEVSSSFVDKILDIILAKLSDWGVTISRAFTRIADLAVGTLRVENQICVDDVCINKDQLKALLTQTGGAGAGSNENSPTISNGPSVTIQGNNPADIEMGAVYVDLGATVIDDEDDNLGLRYFVNGVKVAEISVDTSTSTTHIIEYVATDSDGNTATSTREVVVVGNQQPASEDQPPTETPPTETTTEGTDTPADNGAATTPADSTEGAQDDGTEMDVTTPPADAVETPVVEEEANEIHLISNSPNS